MLSRLMDPLLSELKIQLHFVVVGVVHGQDEDDGDQVHWFVVCGFEEGGRGGCYLWRRGCEDYPRPLHPFKVVLMPLLCSVFVVLVLESMCGGDKFGKNLRVAASENLRGLNVLTGELHMDLRRELPPSFSD